MDLLQKLFAAAPARPRREDVEPEFGFSAEDAVYYEGLSAAERTQYFRTLMRFDRRNRPRPSSDPHGEARLVAWCMKAAGKRIVPESDVPLLSTKFPAQIVTRAYVKCAELSGISEKDEDDLAEELAADPFASGPLNSPTETTSST